MPNWKNRLRGAKNPHRALSELRPEIEPRHFIEVLSWLPNLGGRKWRALNPPFPTDFRSLMRQEVPLGPLSFRNELLWIASRIVLHADRINEYLRLKTDLEDLWLSGQQRGFEERLADFERLFGASLFLIELKTTSLQKWKGLEPQKSFSSTVRKQSPSQIVRFLSFHMSERSEDATNPFLFRRRIEKTVDEFLIKSATKKYLRYRLIGDLPDGIGDLAGVLRHEANSSLIDQYETLVNCLCENVRYSEHCIHALRFLTSSIADPRLERAMVLFGEIPLSASPDSALSLRAEHALDCGHPAKAIQLLDQNGSDTDPRQFALRSFANADIGHISDTKSAIPAVRMCQLLTSLSSKVDGYEDRLAELIKLLYCSNLFIYLDLVRPALFELAADHYHYSEAVLCRYFTAGGNLTPALLPIIPPGALQTFCDALTRAGYQFDSRPDQRDSSLTISGILRWKLSEDNDEAALKITDVTLDSLPVRVRRQTIRRRVHALLAMSDLKAALFCIATEYLNDSDILLMVPIKECVSYIDDEADPDEIGDPLFTAIVYDLYLRFYGDDRPYVRSDAFEDFLALHHLKRPSDLDLKEFEPFLRPYLIYFLRYICLPEVMLSSPHFENSRSLESERIKICTLLIDIDPTNAFAYEQELRDITRKMVVSEGLRDVEQSKFAMDMSPLRRWADKHLKESFARFKALRVAGVVASDLQELPSAEGDIALPESPIDEAASLLKSMLEEFLFECYTNSFYGLDSYLSLRARHGSLSGQLRAPLEEERIITQRAEGSGIYNSNAYWLKRISNPWIIEKLDSILKNFSKAFDSMVQSFADNQLQIATSKTPHGLFAYRIIDLDLLSVSADVRTNSIMATFVDRCIDVFWANLDDALKVVRSYIEGTLRNQVSNGITTLLQELESLRVSDDSLDDLISAVRRAQSRLHHSLNSLQSWFFLPKSVSTKPFTIDEMVDISLQQVKKLHPTFAPLLRREGTVSTILLGRRIPDMLFIIFENIQKHSGMEHPRINLAILQQAGRITFCVTSDYQPTEDLEDRLSRIRQTIESGKYQHIVRSEGGTGLVKLWNIIKSEFPAPNHASTLTFGDCDGRFKVEVSFPVTVILEGV